MIQDFCLPLYLCMHFGLIVLLFMYLHYFWIPFYIISYFWNMKIS